MPSLVVDASVAIKWFNPAEALANCANLIRDDYVHGRVDLMVPAFWDYEMVNGMNKAVARGDLTAEEGRAAVRLILAIQARRVPLPPPDESYELAQRYQRSVYDSWYVALAQHVGGEFWTADRKLYNAMHESLAFVRWLGDYQSAEAASDKENRGGL
ncbi:type II toxin-antitoxin system VapC family toxin [Candidatus Entotheonella palauensis]|uniref:type II toxin-antitoxin system VapC family toxin n=1 Tax=Candidatus Entotheonella palauensis TaxID=93172 RepID=UPI000B7E89D5|nr:type II toxin-antitoxin system VapC family toxin [Candidatus Entotheonella palauensis]